MYLQLKRVVWNEDTDLQIISIQLIVKIHRMTLPGGDMESVESRAEGQSPGWCQNLGAG